MLNADWKKNVTRKREKAGGTTEDGKQIKITHSSLYEQKLTFVSHKTATQGLLLCDQ